MRALKPLELGLMFWAKEDARQTLQEVKAFGVNGGQLGIPGELKLTGQASRWKAALADEKFLALTAVCSYVGEDYTDIPAVQRTVGLVPNTTRAERVDRTKQVATLAAELGIPSVACHIGFEPHDTADPLYSEMLATAREVCDYCRPLGQSFALETGQEPAPVLLRFIADVNRPNLKINFDPANMILYGTGDPIEAVNLLRSYIVSVHCKDGDWPPPDVPDALGIERPLGKGSVNMARFLSALNEIGYRGMLTLEREEQNPQQRVADIRSGLALLKELTSNLSS
jgi:sugar phosphate isomerase/epimerase